MEYFAQMDSNTAEYVLLPFLGNKYYMVIAVPPRMSQTFYNLALGASSISWSRLEDTFTAVKVKPLRVSPVQPGV